MFGGDGSIWFVQVRPDLASIFKTRESIDVRKALIVVAAAFIGFSAVGCDDEPPQQEAEAEQVDDAEPEEETGDAAEQVDESDPEPVEEPGEEPTEEDEVGGVDEDFEYPGFDLEELDDDQRMELADLAYMELCPCDDATESLHECMQHEERCQEADDEMSALVEVVTEAEDEQDAFERRAEQRADSAGEHQFSLDGPYKGSADADVIIVEFADFQCPHCRTAAAAMEQVYDRFGDDVGIFFKNFPVGGPVAEQAARAALAAGEQGRFWEMHQLLFEHQRQLDRRRIERFARQLGLNMDRFRQDMNSQEITGQIVADQQEGAEAGVRGTPTIFINGERYTGQYSGMALSAKVASVLEE